MNRKPAISSRKRMTKCMAPFICVRILRRVRETGGWPGRAPGRGDRSRRFRSGLSMAASVVPPGEVTFCRRVAGEAWVSRAMRAASQAVFHGEGLGKFGRKPEVASSLCHRLHQVEEIGGPAAGNRGDGIEGGFFLHPERSAHSGKNRFRGLDGASSPAPAFAYSTLTPARSRAGVLGMQRTMGWPGEVKSAMPSTGTPAQIETTSVSAGIARLASTLESTCGLTARTTAPARSTTS